MRQHLYFKFIQEGTLEPQLLREPISQILASNSNFETVDVLVNNAGLISPMLHFFEADETWWRRIIDVNLTGHFLSLIHI